MRLAIASGDIYHEKMKERWRAYQPIHTNTLVTPPLTQANLKINQYPGF
ncbi:MAG: hypothetical protein HOI55_05715 [Candidatus Marinimicrobia bacterium]|nr:hypothetical protein [Candidatus Neomarinimicrobiota bacterium]